MWNAQSGELVKSFAAHSDRILGAQFVGPQSLYTWSEDNFFRKWELETSDAVLLAEWKTDNQESLNE